MDREHEDARHVILTAGPFFFGKITDKMTAKFVALRHDIEQEGLNVIVESFRPQEKLGQQAEILTIDRVFATVDLEE